jgi:hypothetical protein
LLLVRPEQTDVEPLASSGAFKLWLKRGAVTKFQLELEGVLAVGRWKKVNVRKKAMTTLTNIGSTEVIVPDEARAKLHLARN